MDEPAATQPEQQSKLPINRIVAFLGPYIAVISGWLANWLIVRVHVLSEFNVHKTTIESVLAQIFVFGVTAILVWLGQHKWLTGWQQYEQQIAAQIPDDIADHPYADLTPDDEPASEDFDGPLVDPTDPSHPANQPAEPPQAPLEPLPPEAKQ